MTKLLGLIVFGTFILACNNKPVESPPTTDSTVAVKETKTLPTEIGDPKYIDIGKNQMKALSAGDIDGMMNNFADNALYAWSSGDTLIGKASIAKYWKERRDKIIDSIKFVKPVWLPIKVNTSQQEGQDQPGNWLLSWYLVKVKYKNGKKLAFWVHTLYHFDATDKIDIASEYMDRAPINKALGIK